MNRYLSEMYAAAQTLDTGLTAGALDHLSRVSWNDVHKRAKRMVGALAEVGVKPGLRVCALVIDPVEVAALAQAIWMSGATLTMLQQPSPQATREDWVAATQRSLRVLGCHVVVIGEQYLDMVGVLREGGVVVVQSDSLDVGYPLELMRPGEDDVAMYQLTSGSMGSPKAIAISFRNLYTNSLALIAIAAGDRERDVMVSWLPLSHDLGMVGFLLTPMHHGVETVKVSPADFARWPLSWLRLISDHRGTITGGPGFAYSLVGRLLQYVDDGVYDLSSLRFATCAGEPIHMSTLRSFISQAGRFGFSHSAMVNGYGMAETTLGVAFTPLGKGIQVETVDRDTLYDNKVAAISSAETPLSKEIALAGPPIPGMELRIMDASVGGELPTRHVGEITVRGDAVTKTYLTEDGPMPATDEAGWLHTGDIGYVTEDGCLAVCGRSKNILIVGGRNVFPGDLELLAESISGVRKGGVLAIGVMRDDFSEDVYIIAELSSARVGLDREQVKQAVMRRVLSAVGLTPVVVLVPKGSLPRTPSGKLSHGRARELYVPSVEP
jgi:fatty-acyl-CoA synthase